MGQESEGAEAVPGFLEFSRLCAPATTLLFTLSPPFPSPLEIQIDEPNAFGNTALHIACYLGQDAVAIELVNAGANVNQPNDKGFTPLHVAAVSTNGALCLELLVNNGADVNYQVPKGWAETRGGRAWLWVPAISPFWVTLWELSAGFLG